VPFDSIGALLEPVVDAFDSTAVAFAADGAAFHCFYALLAPAAASLQSFSVEFETNFCSPPSTQKPLPSIRIALRAAAAACDFAIHAVIRIELRAPCRFERCAVRRIELHS